MLDFDLEAIFSVVTAVIAAASAITALTKTPSDDRLVGKIYRVVEMFALVTGRTKETAKKSD